MTRHDLKSLDRREHRIHWIVGAAILGPLLVAGLVCSITQFAPTSIASVQAEAGTTSTHDLFWRAIVSNPPWQLVGLLGTLAATPSLMLTWYWRTTQKDSDLKRAQEELEVRKRELEREERRSEQVSRQELPTRFETAMKRLLKHDVPDSQLIAAIHELSLIGSSQDGWRNQVRYQLSKFVVANIPRTRASDSDTDLDGNELQQPHQGAAIAFSDTEAESRRKHLSTACDVLVGLGGGLWSDEDLSFGDLRNLDFSNADLSHANLNSTNLKATRFSGADLRGATAISGLRMEQVGYEEFEAHGWVDCRYSPETFVGATFDEDTKLPGNVDQSGMVFISSIEPAP